MSYDGYTPGGFDLLQNDRVKVLESNFYQNPKSLNELMKPIQAAQCILGHQNPQLIPKMQNNLCVGMTVIEWRTCDMVISDNCEQTCDPIGGNLPGLSKLDFDPNGCLKVEFGVKERFCDNMVTWEEIVARQRAKAKVLMECELAERLLVFLQASADTIDLTDIPFDANYTVNGNCIEIPSSEWSLGLFSQFQYLAGQLDMMNVLYITGKNFADDKFMNQYRSSSCCNNLDILGSNDFNICFDPRNVDSTLGGRYTFMMEQDSILFWNTYEHRSTTPVRQTGDLYEWREMLPRLTYNANGRSNPIYIDVTMQRKCFVANGVRQYRRCYEYMVRYGLHEGPCDCNDMRGILKFKNYCLGC